MRRFIWPLFWTLLTLSVTVALCIFNATAREVIGGAALTTFQVVTSPFILESTLVLIGICVVLGLSQRRQDQDAKDEWVYLDTASSAETTESGVIATTPPQS